MIYLTQSYAVLQKHSWLLPAFFGALLLFHVLFANGGYFGNDDMVYAKYAAGLFDKAVTVCNYCNHFQLRWTPVFTTFLSYKLFGISDISTAVYSSLTTFFTGFAVWLFVKKETILIQTFALLFFFFSHAVLVRAHCLSADTGISCFHFFAYYFYHQNRFYKSDKSVQNGLLTAVFLMLCILTKETIIIFLPFWCVLLCTGLFKRRNYQFWMTTTVSFCVFAFLYILYFKVTTGDWWYRYHLLIYNSQNGEQIYADGVSSILTRVGYELWYNYLLNGDMEYILIALCGFVYTNSVCRSQPAKHVLFSFFILLLCSNFMSFSITEYSPLWPDPRHFLFIIPFVSIAVGYMLAAYLKTPLQYWLLPASFAVASVIIYSSPSKGMKYIYFAFAAVLIIIWLQARFVNQTSYTWLWSFFLIAIISCNYLYDFAVRQNTFYYSLKNIIITNFANQLPDETNIVYTGDVMTAAYSEYFLSFKNRNTSFANVDTCTSFTGNSRRYILTNKDYNPKFARAVLDYDSLKKTKAMQERMVTGNTFLYEVKDTSVLRDVKRWAGNTF